MSNALAAPDLAVQNLAVSLGGRRILAPLTTCFGPGLTLVIGPNGAGKSTLLKAMLGLFPADGQVRLGASPLAALPPRQRARTIAYLPQGHEAHWPLAVRDIVALGRHPHGAGDPDRLAPVDAAAVAAAMAVTDVTALADRSVTTLSGGERARVALARVLAVEAAILLCDEPTAALDPGHQLAVTALLHDRARQGATVIAVTHDLTLAARFADRILLLNKGLLVADGPPKEVLTVANLAAVYGITAFSTSHGGEAVLLPWERTA